MEYKELIEARRRLTYSRTLYQRLCAKNANAEEDYLAKIERLRANVDRLEAEAEHK